MARVIIPPVRTPDGAKADKDLALKTLEAAAELFGAWKAWDYWRALDIEARHPGIDLAATLEIYRQPIVEGCAEVIQAACDLLAALGVTDLTDGERGGLS